MSEPALSQTDVLVIGAGPTGLMMAAELRRYGIACRVVDKNSARSDKSKALGVQSRTLEVLSLIGDALSEEAIQSGRKAQDANLYVDGELAARADLSSIPSRFPYLLFLEQSETERILEEHLNRLGTWVERNTELVSFRQDEEGVASVLKDEEGHEFRIRAKFLIGCDGAHSAVRHGMNVRFGGAPYEGEFLLGDVEVEWGLAYGEAHTFVSSHGLMACFPMRGERRYRIILVPQLKSGKQDVSLSLEELEGVAQKFVKGGVKLSNPVWLTRFRLHHRMASAFREDRVFLAGDAAHIHSPAGGQGMNTGIQDAHNLAWKIAYVLRGRAREDLLESYASERIPVARGVVRGTDRAFRLALLPNNPLIRFARSQILRRLIGVRMLQKRMARVISQVAISYSASPWISSDGDRGFRHGPRGGSRAPDAIWHEGGRSRRVYELLEGTRFTLLAFTDDGVLTPEICDLQTKWSGVLQAHAVPRLVSPQAVREYGAEFPCVYLVRPDGFVALRGRGLELAGVVAWLEAHLNV
jgi:2-polyprenyl-6-methoxyphenol hydroxylase-like FAD-dependent oxidoreductase